MSGSVLIIVILAILLGWWLWRQGQEDAWMPSELRRGELVHAEKLFRAPGPVALTAKVDRAYRVKGQALVLVELKTRRIDRPYRSDVIELSAQRVAIMRQTGEAVSMHAYVVVQTGTGKRTAHRVKLLSAEEVDALVDRREAILEGSVQPRGACVRNLCRQCGFEKECTVSRA